MDRRRLQLANSNGGGDKVWTVTPGTNCKDLYLYLVDKYGLNYGGRNKPLPINEKIYLQGFQLTGDGQVKYLFLDKGLPHTTTLGWLYLENYRDTYYVIRLFNDNYDELEVVATRDEFWD